MTFRSLILAVAALLTASCGQKDDEAAAPAPAAPGAEQTAGPALWRFGDADTTIYLFGTVHVLPAGLAWRTPAIDAAFTESKAVYFETDINPNMAELQGLIMRVGVYQPPETLSAKLGPDNTKELAEVAADLSLPMFQLETMKPWLAAITLAEQLITRAGYDPMSGVERTLWPVAKTAGKEIRTLETIESQLRVFADLPEDVQINYLMDGVRNLEEDMGLLDDLVAGWSRGDVATLEEIMIADDLAALPQIYDALLVKRNAAWTDQLDALVKNEAGVFFVAVGAAHLAGKDSVQTMLAAGGHAVERIN